MDFCDEYVPEWDEKLSGEELPLRKLVFFPFSFSDFLMISSADSLPERLLSYYLLRFFPRRAEDVICC